MAHYWDLGRLGDAWVVGERVSLRLVSRRNAGWGVGIANLLAVGNSGGLNAINNLGHVVGSCCFGMIDTTRLLLLLLKLGVHRGYVDEMLGELLGIGNSIGFGAE